jgi:hypothetical protein
MRGFAAMINLDVWYAHADMDQLRVQFGPQLTQRQRKVVDKDLARARTRDSMQALGKLTRLVDGRLRIVSDPPLLVPTDELLSAETDRSAFARQLNSLLVTTMRWSRPWPRAGSRQHTTYEQVI